MRGSIAIIDDSPTIRRIAEVFLAHEGFLVQSFPDGVEALHHLSQPHTPLPDLVFLDLNMPKLNGYQVALRIKHSERLAHIPVIFLTRYDGVIDHLKCRLAGGEGHISKPFLPATICECASQLLISRSTLRERGTHVTSVLS
ncbi:response regulator [Ktedonospora formicarum]|uniref:response regulator n=1 Tax=Ktedonospora formicarum TaxID=2778364 RepID=UPI001C689449|nr:response regulator [Ktedonospora formicarum]